MKIKHAMPIEGHIVASRRMGETSNPFCIHNVMFNNGKFAVVRAASGICLKPGDTLHRNESAWFCNNIQTHLLPFEYIEENESQRLLNEY